jgi:hypothetical protein
MHPANDHSSEAWHAHSKYEQKIFERKNVVGKKRGWVLVECVISRVFISHQLTMPRTASTVVSAAATTVLRTRLTKGSNGAKIESHNFL